MGGQRRRSGAEPTEGLAALIVRRHETLCAHAGPARQGKVEGVHQARVASRRLREVVPVLGHGLDGIRLKPLRRELRDLTRALGAVRELDVALGMIHELPFETRDARRLRAAWRHHLQARRRDPVRSLRRVLAPDLRRALDRNLAAFVTARAAAVDDGWREALARRLAERARDLRDRIERTGTLYQPEPLHEVRIAVKKLRYVLEISAEAGLARLVMPLRTLKGAQESLGRLHDLDVLLTLLREVPGAAPGDAWQHAAASVEAHLEDASRALHRRYLRATPSLLRVTDTSLTAVLPKVRRLRTPQNHGAGRGH